MKKITGLFLLLLLLNATTVLAGYELNATNFPNAAFRSLVSEFDLDSDGWLVYDEFIAVTEIDCKKNTKITNLKGIEIFESLKSLSCWQCPIGKLDVSNNKQLEYLDCCECGLSTLDVLSNPGLKQLWCYGNSIKTLDIHSCKYLVKAANNGVYNNDKYDGKACSYADEDTSSYLVVDKNITLVLGSGKKITSGKDGSGSGTGSGSGSGDDPQQGSGTGTGDEEEINEGMGGLGSPAHKRTFLLGATVPINIQPVGQISLGGISISGTLKITLNGKTKYTENISTTGTSGYYNTSYKPDEIGTYWIDVSLGYYLSGTKTQTSRYKRAFYVVIPECATHTYGKWTVTKKPTYTTTGTRQRVCTVCGHVQTETMSKLKVKAGAELSSAAAKYVVQDDLKSVSYKAPISKNVKNVTIPATIKLAGKSYKVVAVSSKAFSGCAKLEVLTVGKYVTTIGTSACSDCGALKAVTLGKGVTAIGAKAFYNCGKLDKIKIASKKLSKVGAKALSGISAKAVIEVLASKLADYKKLFKGKGQGSGVKIKAAK